MGLVSLASRKLQTVAMTRFAAFLASVFAVVAVFLGTIGVYAVLAFGVAQRRRELAIRPALGANRRVIIGDVIRKALGLTAVGVMMALVATRLLAGLVSALLGAEPDSVRTFGMASALMLLIALVAAPPAQRSAPSESISRPSCGRDSKSSNHSAGLLGPTRIARSISAAVEGRPFVKVSAPCAVTSSISSI